MSTSEQAPSSGLVAPPIAGTPTSRQTRRWPVAPPISSPVVSPVTPPVISPVTPPVVPPEPLLLPVPPRYHLGHALRYSGLHGLPPIVYREDGAIPKLQAVLYPEAAGFRAAGTPLAVEVLVIQPPSQSQPLPHGGEPLLVYGLPPSPLADALLEQLRLMLRLDDDLGVFYRLAEQDPELAWAAACDGGRLLRAPTAFEDLGHCLALAHGSPSQVVGLLQQLCDKLGPRTTLGRHGWPSAAAIADAPPRHYEHIVNQAAGPARLRKRLGRALRELAQCCASGSLHPESLRRRPGELTRAIDLDDDAWQNALHEELEWQERVRSLLQSLPGYKSPGTGARAVEEMLLRVGCYDGLRLDTAARAAWERRFPAPAATPVRKGRGSGRRGTPADAQAPAPPADFVPRTRAERHAHGLLIARRIARRVSPFSIYRGLAQALLLRVPPAAYSPRQ